MSNSNSLVTYNKPGSGTAHMHNFTNRYVHDADLQKPSREVAGAITTATSQQINRLVTAKTEPAYVRIIFLFHLDF
jgi:hypothetical protein